MRIKTKPIPDELKESLYRIPYTKKSPFKIKALIPITAIAVLLILFLIYPKEKKHADITYFGPKDGDVILTSEFSIISKEPIEIYVNSQPIKPIEDNGYYIFEKTLEEGEHKIEIIKGEQRKEVKIYVVDIPST